MNDKEVFERLKAEAVRRGYTIQHEESDAKIVEKVIRPDGTIAIVAKKNKEQA